MTKQSLAIAILAALIFASVMPARARRMTELVSPCLLELKAELEGGNSDAVGEFWTRIETEGTPLIEPIEGTSDHVWLTFLYRGDESTETVVVIGGVSGEDPTDRALERLGTTDVWYITFRMRNDLRARYGFSVNDELTPINYDDREEVQRRIALFGPDPLSKSKPTQNLSLLELAGAPPQPWIEPNPRVPKGELVKDNAFRSEILDNERRIVVYLPPGYRETGETYPVLLVFDLFPYLSQVPTPRILNNMIAAGEIPPIVAVLVGNVAGQRGTEMGCNDDFNAFLAAELIPWVRDNFRVSEDPADAIVAGSSSAGVAATFFALKHSELIGNVLSQSGSYMFSPDQGDIDQRDPEFKAGWLIRQYAEAERKPIRFFLEVGLREPGIPRMPVIHRHFRDVLQAKGYDVVAYSEFNGGHDYLNWRGSISDGLIALLRD